MNEMVCNFLLLLALHEKHHLCRPCDAELAEEAEGAAAAGPTPLPSPPPPFLGSRRAAPPLAIEDDDDEEALFPAESILASSRAFFLWRGMQDVIRYSK